MDAASSEALSPGIVAIALELSPGLLPASEAEAGKPDQTKWACLDDCLSRIQTEARHYKPVLQDALILTLASWTWCLSTELVRASQRWNSLARAVMADVIPGAASGSDTSAEEGYVARRLEMPL